MHTWQYSYCILDGALFIGIGTKTCIQKLVQEGDISQTQVTKFYASARAFYVRSMEYALANLPVKDSLLENAAFKQGKVLTSLKWSE